MSNAPAFFVPAATAENVEQVYASFAKMADRPVPAPGERIYSITYVHNGEVWTATVGERLSAMALDKPQRDSFERLRN